MDKIAIGYFLEDIAHEYFLTALVTRLAEEQDILPDRLIHDVRNASGGRGKVLDELKRFLGDISLQQMTFDVLIIAIDGDCVGYRQRRDEIRRVAAQKEYRRPMVCAVPDPHIERWYLADAGALYQIVGLMPECPSYKCKRDLYKQALETTLRKGGISAPLGGVEYGEDIARKIDIFKVGIADAGFKHFVDDLKEALRPFVGQGIRSREQPSTSERKPCSESGGPDASDTPCHPQETLR